MKLFVRCFINLNFSKENFCVEKELILNQKQIQFISGFNKLVIKKDSLKFNASPHWVAFPSTFISLLWSQRSACIALDFCEFCAMQFSVETIRLNDDDEDDGECRPINDPALMQLRRVVVVVCLFSCLFLGCVHILRNSFFLISSWNLFFIKLSF